VDTSHPPVNLMPWLEPSLPRITVTSHGFDRSFGGDPFRICLARRAGSGQCYGGVVSE